MKLLFIFVLIATDLFPIYYSVAATESRTWTDMRGRTKVAIFDSATGLQDDDFVTLLDPDFHFPTTVQIRYLAPGDREYVRELIRRKPDKAVAQIAQANKSPPSATDIKGLVTTLPGTHNVDTNDPFHGLFTDLPGTVKSNPINVPEAASPTTRLSPSSPKHHIVDVIEALPDKWWDMMSVLILLILIGPVALVFTFRLERKRKLLYPNQLPYKWGYFNGVYSLILLPIALFGIIFSLTNDLNNDPDNILFWSLIGLVQGVLAWFVIKRHRVCWIIYLFLSFNPIFWLISGVYLRNRWREMAPNSQRSVLTQ